MLNDPTPESGSGFRIYVALSAAAFLFAGLYLAWVFYSRSEANHAIEEKAAEKVRTEDRQSFEMMGGNRFAILGFYADPANIRAGEKTSLCYSVSNAKTVKLEPQSEPVWPAFRALRRRIAAQVHEIYSHDRRRRRPYENRDP